jgi:signal transduction histidine kinase
MVTLRCDPELPVVWADHDRLEQVFVNLLDNALRHNPAGTRVTVDARADGDAVLVSVSDDGPGIPADIAAALFEQTGRRRRAPTAGAGLGLSIAKGIVDAHGSALEVARLEHGTRFSIRLPSEQIDVARADGR